MPDVFSTPIMHLFLPAAATSLLMIAALKDIAVRSIPDFVSIGLIVIGFTARTASQDATAALAASSIVFIVGALCWRQGWLGGGDVKLGAACAWLMAPALVPRFMLLTALVGGALACLYLIIGWFAKRPHAPDMAARPRSLVARVWRIEQWRISRQGSLPYGCAIAAAALLIMSSG